MGLHIRRQQLNGSPQTRHRAHQGLLHTGSQRRRSARCPLCKGSPLYDSGAVKHAKAHRMRPLNHGATAVLSILFLNRFRCMYCGTPYDMLKAPSTARHKHQELP